MVIVLPMVLLLCVPAFADGFGEEQTIELWMLEARVVSEAELDAAIAVVASTTLHASNVGTDPEGVSGDVYFYPFGTAVKYWNRIGQTFYLQIDDTDTWRPLRPNSDFDFTGLGDVDWSTAWDGSVPYWDAAAGILKPTSQVAGGGGAPTCTPAPTATPRNTDTPIPVPDLDDLGNVDTTGKTSGQVPYWNGSVWGATDQVVLSIDTATPQATTTPRPTTTPQPTATLHSTATPQEVTADGGVTLFKGKPYNFQAAGSVTVDVTEDVNVINVTILGGAEGDPPPPALPTSTPAPTTTPRPTVTPRVTDTPMPMPTLPLLDDLRDVNAANPTPGQALFFNGAEYEFANVPIGGASSFADLGDTSIVLPATGEIAIFNGAVWVNGAPSMPTPRATDTPAPTATLVPTTTPRPTVTPGGSGTTFLQKGQSDLYPAANSVDVAGGAALVIPTGVPLSFDSGSGLLEVQDVLEILLDRDHDAPDDGNWEWRICEWEGSGGTSNELMDIVPDGSGRVRIFAELSAYNYNFKPVSTAPLDTLRTMNIADGVVMFRSDDVQFQESGGNTLVGIDGVDIAISDPSGVEYVRFDGDHLAVVIQETDSVGTLGANEIALFVKDASGVSGGLGPDVRIVSEQGIEWKVNLTEVP